MLAENEPATRKRLTKALAAENLDVEPVTDGRAVLEKVRTDPPDIVLLDLAMPQVDGATMIRALRESGSDVPVVVMTARNDVDGAIEAIKQGAADYIVKPFNKDDLLARVHRALAGARETTATLDVRLRELHDPSTGRIDARKLAVFLAIPLAQLAAALDALPATVHKSPAAPALQKRLQPIKRAIDAVSRATRSQVDARAWLNNPHPDLDGRTPLDVILDGHSEAVATLLENAAAGLPS
ncbi:MAG: response regulator [Acidobacteria bacterium]|nr:response regulator [Acidobacteriota bacterium]